MKETKVTQLTAAQKVAQQLAVQKRASDRADSARRRADKQPAINAYQQGEITAKEYEELVGESYVETQKEAYEFQVQTAQENLATKVRGGFLAADDYAAIVGKPYDPEEV